MGELSEAKYRFLRRYLMKFHPEIAKNAYVVEGLSPRQIKKKEKELIDWKIPEDGDNYEKFLHSK